ncbi:MAG: glutamine--tRNA ligase, partial [Rhodospirillales bacterium]
VEMAFLDHCAREVLNKTARRRLGVLKPLKVVIENYPESQTEEFEALNHPGDETAGTRKVPFSRVIYVEQDDFMEDPPKKFFRLGPGREVRLRFAYLITCTDVIKDVNGAVSELRCTYDPKTKGGNAPDGRKVKGTIHWVSAAHAIDAEVRLYEPLFTTDDPGSGGIDFLDNINKDSLQVLTGCKLEPSLKDLETGQTVQFERQGYFCADTESTLDAPVFNRTIGLRDSWAKEKNQEKNKS